MSNTKKKSFKKGKLRRLGCVCVPYRLGVWVWDVGDGLRVVLGPLQVPVPDEPLHSRADVANFHLKLPELNVSVGEFSDSTSFDDLWGGATGVPYFTVGAKTFILKKINYVKKILSSSSRVYACLYV